MTTNLNLPSTREGKDAVLAVLKAIDPINFPITDGEPDDRDLKFDPDGRVHPYAVLYLGNTATIIQRMCRTPDVRNFGFQVTAVGGDNDRCLWAVDLVEKHLVGRRLTLPGGESTPINQEPISGPSQIDRSVNPTRTYLPLFFFCRLA